MKNRRAPKKKRPSVGANGFRWRILTGDLVSDKNPLFERNKSFVSYAELYDEKKGFSRPQSQKKQRKSIYAMLVVRLFLKMLMDDLIYHNDIFVFPRSNFCKISIRKINSPKFKSRYDIELNGDKYMLWMDMGRQLMKSVLKSKTRYYFWMGRSWYYKMRDQIINGHTYQEREPTKYTNDELEQLCKNKRHLRPVKQDA